MLGRRPDAAVRSTIFVAFVLCWSILLTRPVLSSMFDRINNNQQDFLELLDAFPTDSLHAALHRVLDARFQDGIWERDRQAVEALHSEDAPLATRVLTDAATEIMRRQNDNSSVSSGRIVNSATTASSARISSTTPSSLEPAITPIVVTTTDSVGSSVAITSSAVQLPSTGIVSTITNTDVAGSIVRSAATVPANVGASDGTTVTTPVSRFTAVPIAITTTDAVGSTFVTTYTPDGVGVSRLVLSTITLPDGSRSTVTSFAAYRSTSASTSGPRLQNAATLPVLPSVFELLAIIAGVVLVVNA